MQKKSTTRRSYERAASRPLHRQANAARCAFYAIWSLPDLFMSTYLRPHRYSPEQGDLVEQLASAVRDTGERIVADRDWEISLLV
jgi:hypothetical protein